MQEFWCKRLPPHILILLMSVEVLVLRLVSTESAVQAKRLLLEVSSLEKIQLPLGGVPTNP